MGWLGGEYVINDLEEKTLKKVYADISSNVRHNADLEEFPNMGMNIMPIQRLMKGKIYESYDEATQAIEDRYAEWVKNCNVVVAFYDTDAAKQTKKLENLMTRFKKEEQKLSDYVEKTDCKNFKAKLITCPSCESKINKKYIRRSSCPLCHADLRSKTVIDTTNRYCENIKKLKKEITQEQNKQKDRLPVRYLVRYYEYVG